jgi:hypothetical protein
VSDDVSDDDLLHRLRQDYARLPTDGPADVPGLARRALGSRRRRRIRAAAAVGAVAAAVASVAVAVGLGGGADRASDFSPATTTYDGPLDAAGRFGAAGQAVDCVYRPVGSRVTTTVYEGGATSDSPAGAVETAYSEGLFLSAPDVDLALAAQDDDRQLLTYEVGGRVLMALLLHDGPATEGAGGAGWYVEAYARCDFAEFPEEVARTPLTPYLVWTDADGVPVPVARSTPHPVPSTATGRT